jgi:hypothetical protein
VFGGTPNTATGKSEQQWAGPLSGLVALPNPCSLVEGSTDNVEKPFFLWWSGPGVFGRPDGEPSQTNQAPVQVI